MKKLINDPQLYVEDSLQGVLAAYSTHLTRHPQDHRAVYRPQSAQKDAVSIVTGGGYGHLPVFLGYVGAGLCDGVAVGNVFSAPGSNTILQVTRSVENRRGVIYLCGNYMGDIINFEMARELAAAEGIAAHIVVVADDAATAPRANWKERRGISGLVFAYKIAGAAAQAGWPVEEVIRVTEKAISQMASFGVAFKPCQLPSTCRPVFEIAEDEMELGVGIHGEQGVERCKIMPSREIAALTVQKLTRDLTLCRGDRIAVLVNGMGGTTQEELFIYYGDIRAQLDALEIYTARSFVGEYLTTMETSGALVTLLRLDDELVKLLDQPAFSPFLHFAHTGQGETV